MTAMKKSFICGVFVCLSTVLHAQVTIGRCVALAQENYPLVKKRSEEHTSELQSQR